MVYKFFDKKTMESVAVEPNLKLADELHQPIIRKI